MTNTQPKKRIVGVKLWPIFMALSYIALVVNVATNGLTIGYISLALQCACLALAIWTGYKNKYIRFKDPR